MHELYATRPELRFQSSRADTVGWPGRVPLLVARPATRQSDLSRQQSGSESVFVWGAFSAKGTSELTCVDVKLNVDTSIDTLGNYLFCRLYT